MPRAPRLRPRPRRNRASSVGTSSSTNVAPSIAFGFYAALFDWDEITQHDMGPMGMYLVFGRNGKQLGGMFDKGSTGKPGNAYWLGYVSVTDLDGTIERAKGARGSLLTGPMDVPGGDRIAQLMDPHGAFFALHKAAGAQAAPAEPAAKPRKAAKPVAAKPAARRSPRLRRSRGGNAGEAGSSRETGGNAGEAGGGSAGEEGGAQAEEGSQSGACEEGAAAQGKA